MSDVEARRVCVSCGEPTDYVVRDDGSIGGTAVSECCREPLRIEIVSGDRSVEAGSGFGTYVSRAEWESFVDEQPSRDELTAELAVTKEIDHAEAAGVVAEALRDGPLSETNSVVFVE